MKRKEKKINIYIYIHTHTYIYTLLSIFLNVYVIYTSCQKNFFFITYFTLLFSFFSKSILKNFFVNFFLIRIKKEKI